MKGLEVIQLDKKFSDQQVLENISFSIKTEQHTVILGVSGCGKSTLLRLISGLLPPNRGEIIINDEIISSTNTIILKPHLRMMGLVFQDLALWSNLTVLKNITLVLSAKKFSAREVKKKSSEVMDMCGISLLANRKPAEISGGQQQRVALARAIVLKPSYLLLDEPFSGLDLTTKYDLMKDLVMLANQQNSTIILVTHDPFEAIFFAKQALILDKGKIAECGEFDEMLLQSKNEIMVKFRKQLKMAKA